MVDARIGRWLLRSDEHCWSVGEAAIRTGPDGEEREYTRSPRYYASIGQAVKGLGEMELRHSDARSLQELREICRSFTEVVEAAFAGQDLTPRVRAETCLNRAEGQGPFE